MKIKPDVVSQQSYDIHFSLKSFFTGKGQFLGCEKRQKCGDHGLNGFQAIQLFSDGEGRGLSRVKGEE